MEKQNAERIKQLKSTITIRDYINSRFVEQKEIQEKSKCKLKKLRDVGK